ncbi:hypothetical protein Plhal304r1_c031g0100311 [Plasmopara halstedii]
MDPPSTSRLRRRSFFEGMESEGSSTESVTLNEIDVASVASVSTSLGDNESYGVVNPLVKPGKVSPAKQIGAKVSSDDQDSLQLSHITRQGKQRGLRLVQDSWGQVLLWLQMLYDMWASRFPIAASKVDEVRQMFRWLWKGPPEWIKKWKGDPSAPIKYWVYPTHWLTYASLSLVVIQILIFWKFQTVFFHLRVHECVFHERLLASVNLMQPVPTTHVPPGAVALRFLERRFEQQYSPGARQPGQARLPRTCLAIIPTGSDQAMAQATELAFLWPRSQVVATNAYSKVASIIHVAVGASPLERETETRSATDGVFAALFPLNAIRPALFAPRFPDLILVKTEFALRQMLKFRQEQQEKRDHRGRAGGNPPSALGRPTLVESGTSDLAPSHFGVYLLKTTVPDVYNRNIRKKWDEFLHVVVVSDTDKKEQYTEELLAAWVAHPEWPILHVRFEQSLALCGSFQRILSSMLKNYHANVEGAEAAEAAAATGQAAEDWLQRFNKLEKPTKNPTNNLLERQSNVDLVCSKEANGPQEIVRLKNTIGMHLFPVPPELEKHEEKILESLAVGALTVTYNSPIMQEWVPDRCGLRVGSFHFDGSTGLGAAEVISEELKETLDNPDDGNDVLVKLPTVRVTSSDIEQAITQLLTIDRVSRVAAGRAARVHYLRIRTHYLSAIAALDTAACEGDSDDISGTQSEIGQHRRRKVEVETLRAFLY